MSRPVVTYKPSKWGGASDIFVFLFLSFFFFFFFFFCYFFFSQPTNSEAGDDEEFSGGRARRRGALWIWRGPLDNNTLPLSPSHHAKRQD